MNEKEDTVISPEKLYLPRKSKLLNPDKKRVQSDIYHDVHVLQQTDKPDIVTSDDEMYSNRQYRHYDQYVKYDTD